VLEELPDVGTLVNNVPTSDLVPNLRLRMLDNCWSPLILEWILPEFMQEVLARLWMKLEWSTNPVDCPTYMVRICESRDCPYRSIVYALTLRWPCLKQKQRGRAWAEAWCGALLRSGFIQIPTQKAGHGSESKRVVTASCEMICEAVNGSETGCVTENWHENELWDWKRGPSTETGGERAAAGRKRRGKLSSVKLLLLCKTIEKGRILKIEWKCNRRTKIRIRKNHVFRG